MSCNCKKEKISPEEKKIIAEITARLAPLKDWRDVVADIVEKFQSADIEAIQKMPSCKHVSRFFFGMQIRNTYGLWRKNHITKNFNEELGVYHADDMSGIIMEGIWHLIHDKEYDPKPTVERYRKHWALQGVDMKGEKLGKKELYITKSSFGHGGLSTWYCTRCEEAPYMHDGHAKCNCEESPCPWEEVPIEPKKEGLLKKAIRIIKGTHGTK